MTSQPDYGDSSASPSDDELVDYLLQPLATDGDGRFVGIEHWLASDEANLLRLESLAEAVLIAAGGLPRCEQPPLRPAATRPLASPLAADKSTSVGRSSQSIEGAPPGASDNASQSGRPFLLGVRWAALTLAASLLIALGWRFGLFSVAPSSELSPGRVALAWSEIDSITALDVWETAEETAIEWEEPPAVAAWDGVESSIDAEDAAAGEAPPEWMLIAVTRMPFSEIPGVEATDNQPETLR